MTSLVSFNQLDNPDQVTVGMRLYLKAPKQRSRPPSQGSGQASKAAQPSTAVKPTTAVAVNTAAKPAAEKPPRINKSQGIPTG